MMLQLLYNPAILIVLLVMIFFRVFPSATRNGWYGYRTARSMSSDSSWRIAQRMAANTGVLTASIALICQLVLSGLIVRYADLSIWVLFTGLIVTIILTEKKLKKELRKSAEGD